MSPTHDSDAKALCVAPLHFWIVNSVDDAVQVTPGSAADAVYLVAPSIRLLPCLFQSPLCLSGQQIRLRGKNTTENEHVKLGAYHTLEIEQQRPFTLYKQAWDLLDLERIKQACDPAASADLAAVLITVGLLSCTYWGSPCCFQPYGA